MPQTPIENYLKYSKLQNIKGYNVNVVSANDIPDFYAFIHTPEAGFHTTATRNIKFALLESFSNLSDDKVVCTSYISKDKTGSAGDFGFIFDVQNDKQFVGMNHDMCSHGKDIDNMLIEFYKDRIQWREYISKKIKETMNISGEEYIKRLDFIKKELGTNSTTIENITTIDKEFGLAYKNLFSISNPDDNEGKLFFNQQAATKVNPIFMGKGWWNEFLVNNPKIAAIFTNDIDKLPEEYLIKAQEENLPIVVIK